MRRWKGLNIPTMQNTPTEQLVEHLRSRITALEEENRRLQLEIDYLKSYKEQEHVAITR